MSVETLLGKSGVVNLNMSATSAPVVLLSAAISLSYHSEAPAARKIYCCAQESQKSKCPSSASFDMLKDINMQFKAKYASHYNDNFTVALMSALPKNYRL